MRLLSLTLLLVFSALGHGDGGVPEIEGLFVQEPADQVWRAGGPICYWTNPDDKNCLTLTDMGEIELRWNGAAGRDLESYRNQLSPESQEFTNQYDKLVVRYLATNDHKFLIQVLFQVVYKGSQSLYIFGSLNPDMTVQAEGYGQNQNQIGIMKQKMNNAARAIAQVDDQRLVALAKEISDIYLAKRTGATLPRP